MITGSEAESRALMMNAAVRIVAKHSFEGFTTKKWALEAGVAEGSLYYHFKSKNDLLDETFLMIKHEIEGLYTDEDGIPDNPELLAAFIEELWRRYYHYLLDNPEKTLYYYRYRTSPRYTDALQQEMNPSALPVLFAQLGERLRLEDFILRRTLWCFVLDTTSSFAFRVITGACEHSAKGEKEVVRFMMRGMGSLFEEEGRAAEADA